MIKKFYPDLISKKGFLLNQRVLFYFLLFLQLFIAQSQEIPKRVCYAQRLQTDPPEIDGRLNDLCWEGDGWTGNFIQQQPNEGEPGSQKTEFKILYDDRNLYLAIQAYDREVDKIEARASRRDNFAGDVAGACFDSYYDHRTGYEFNVTAGGTKIDLMQLDTGADWFIDLNWDAVWEGKSTIGDSGWSIEIRIPFSQLRFSQKEEQIWGLHVWRWIDRLQEESQFQLIPLDSQGRVHRFGILKGIKNIRNPKRVELLPYLRSSIKKFKPVAENPFTRSGHSWGQGVGIDGRIGLAANYNLDFTINPDFGQVEADPSVVNLTAFETFYEEKRPFFMEGKQLFDFQVAEQPLFYSRRIGRSPGHYPDLEEDEHVDMPDHTTIIGAAKITGKTSSGWSLGILNSITAKESAKIKNGNSLEETVDPFSNYFVARLQRDFADGNHSLGTIFTAVNRQIGEDHLNFLPKAAYTGGFDATMQWGKRTYYINAKGVFSRIQGDKNAILQLQESSVHNFQRIDAGHVQIDSSRTSLSGTGGEIEIGKGGNGRWRYELGMTWRSPGLELNDCGYLRETDLVEQEIEIAYVVDKPGPILNNYYISLEQYNQWNFNGSYQLTAALLYSFVRFKNFCGMEGYIYREQNRLNTHLLRGGPAIRLPDKTTVYYYTHSDSRKRIQCSIELYKTYYNDGNSYQWHIAPNLYVRESDRLDFSINPGYTVNRDNWQYVKVDSITGNKPYILALINQKTFSLTLRLNYYLTPDLSIQYYGQPFISAGDYKDFKQVTCSKAKNYKNRYNLIDGGKIRVNPETGDINVDEDLNGVRDYWIENPDFNIQEFHSNLVLRWEYKSGSTFYLVWTHGRSQTIINRRFNLFQDLDSLFEMYPDNIFLVKVNHWFSL
jgi:hypothetical protein